MIFLEQITNQCLLEEGQTLVSIQDLGLTWEKIEDLFEQTFEQAKSHLVYWTKQSFYLSPTPIVLDTPSIKRISFNIYQNNYNRLVQDLDQANWEFNPYSKELTAFAGNNYTVEYLAYPTCDYQTYSQVIDSTVNKSKYKFVLPGSFDEGSFKISKGDLILTDSPASKNKIKLTGTLGSGEIDLETNRITLSISDTSNQSMTMSFDTKYKSISTLDAKYELFFKWYKANLLSLIGAIKEQSNNIDSALIPFDVNRDTLLQRARELMQEVNQLKTSLNQWWLF